MPPPCAVITDIDIVQNGSRTTTVNVSEEFKVDVTADFEGDIFPDTMLTDVMAGGIVAFTKNQVLQKAKVPDLNAVFTFTISSLGTIASGDICNVYAVLMASISPYKPPVIASATESFVAF